MLNVQQPMECAICGGALKEELLQIREPDRFEIHAGIRQEGYVRRWVECERCGCATNVHLPENLAKLEVIASGYYEVDFKSSSIGMKYNKVMGLPRSESDNAQRVERIIEFLDLWNQHSPASNSVPRRALDIGAGTGVFLARFLNEMVDNTPQWVGIAVEPDPVAAEHLRSLGQFDVIEEVYTSSLQLERFQLCTLNKVVEHLPDPIGLLRGVGLVLADDGIIYIEVPDKLTIFHRPSNDNILGALHHHLYTMESLAFLCGAAGLMPLKTERHFEPSGKISLSVFAVSADTAAQLAERREK